MVLASGSITVFLLKLQGVRGLAIRASSFKKRRAIRNKIIKEV